MVDCSRLRLGVVSFIGSRNLLPLTTVTNYKHLQVRGVNNTAGIFKWWLWGAFSGSAPVGQPLVLSRIWEVILGRLWRDLIVITYKICPLSRIIVSSSVWSEQEMDGNK